MRKEGREEGGRNGKIKRSEHVQNCPPKLMVNFVPPSTLSTRLRFVLWLESGHPAQQR